MALVVWVTELFGLLVGALLAPLIWLAGFLRDARTFHPDGVVYRAEVVAPAGGAGERLAGAALVRFSGGTFRRPERKDHLGVAIRFRGSADVTHRPGAGDQDLLLATFTRFRRMARELGGVKFRDYLANAYFGVAPYDVAGLAGGGYRLRAVCGGGGGEGSTREERLLLATEAGRAALVVEASRGEKEWTHLCEVRLVERADVDQRKLALSPFRSGRGIRPRGFVHGIRRAAYPASQAGRRARTALS